uniref:Liver-expressed antimicrobial peptide 2 n=1 Tax=Paramormyrops kingsleyae TaxID=1676925 RepID=A0A3B3Q697_9TELE
MPQPVCSMKMAAVWASLLLLLLHQVSAGPLPPAENQHVAPAAVALLRRFARMTPLWRIMGNKPHRAYCQNNYECSTGICWDGHCSFNQPVKSYRTT